MTYKGRYLKGGVVLLDDATGLSEGEAVDVHPATEAVKPRGGKKKRRLTLYDRLKPIIGIAKGLPSDLAENHDHYLYGTPKHK